MTLASFKEDHISQIPDLQLLQQLGWEYLSPEEAVAARGGKPTKRTFEMLSDYFTGLASEHELVAHLDKLKAYDEALTKNQSTTIGESCKQARLAMNAARSVTARIRVWLGSRLIV